LSKDPGRILGHPAHDLVLPPDPLPPVHVRPRPQALQAGELWAQVASSVEDMVEAYCLAAPGKARKARLLAMGAGNRRVREACYAIMKAGCSPARFTSYVVMTTRGRHHRVPEPDQVWGARAIAGWLGEYKRHAAGQSGRATYEAGPARRAQYAERMRFDRFPRPPRAR
jgi:hypothetical protein